MAWRRGVAPAAVAAAGLGLAVWMRGAAVARIGVATGLPLDDAWIHLRFAGNLAAGEGFAFNPGEPSAGCTSPLWVLLLAALRALPGGAVAQALWASALCFAAACGLTAWLAQRLCSRTLPESASPLLPALAGFGAGMAAACTGRFTWSAAAGMEVALAAALMLGLLGVALPPPSRPDTPWRWPWLGLLAGLAVLTRPEAALLALLVLPVAALGRPTGRGGWLAPAASTLALALVVVPWAAWCLALTGRPLPATFGPNRGGLAAPDLDYLRRALLQLASDQPLSSLLALAGCAALVMAARRSRQPALLLTAAWLAALPLASSIVAPNLRHHGRYTMPLIPVLAALAGVGAVTLAAAAGRRLARPRSVLAMALLLGLLPAAAGLSDLPRWREAYGWEVQNIHDQHERVGRWLAEQAGPGCLVATHDIGAIGTLSGCRVIDLIGLVTPAMAGLYVVYPDPLRRDPEIRRLLVQAGVTHVAIYPGWFPSLAADPALTTVFEARLQRLAAAGAPLMRVYRTPAPGPW